MCEERPDAIDRGSDEVRTNMDVRHRELLSRIAAISEEPLATRAEMDRRFDELKQFISRRIDSFEPVVRALVRAANKGG